FVPIRSEQILPIPRQKCRFSCRFEQNPLRNRFAINSPPSLLKKSHDSGGFWSSTESHMRLTSRKVQSIKKEGYFADDAARGLYLQAKRLKVDGQKTDAGFARSWLFRFVSPLTGKTNWQGLGSVSDVSLAEARELASDKRKLVIAGLDPIFEREKEKTAKR